MSGKLIMVRENIQAGATFFRITTDNKLEYSFDKVIWHTAGYLPSPSPDRSGGGNYRIETNNQIFEAIDKYKNAYYQAQAFIDIINNFKVPTGAGDFTDQAEGIQNSAYSDKSLCIALTNLFKLAREVGKGIANGNIEPDDLENAWEYVAQGIGLLAGGLTTAGTKNPMLGAGVGAGVAVAATQAPINWSNFTEGGSWSDETMNEYICCAYNALKGGDFTYADFEAIGTSCGIGAWDEIVSPEVYASLITEIKHINQSGNCACETCLLNPGSEGQILVGKLQDNALVATSVTITTNVFEMQAKVKFTFPSMTITSVRVCSMLKHYENTTASNPLINFSAPSTGGGNTAITNGLSIIDVPSAQLPLVPVTECTVTLKGPLCSACTTAQLASYNDAYASIVWVEICGVN